MCAVPSGEKEKSMDPYLKDPYGCTGALAAKRLERDPFRIGMTYPQGYCSTVVPHLPVPKHPPNKIVFFARVPSCRAGLQGAYPSKNMVFPPHRPLRILTKHFLGGGGFLFHSGVPSCRGCLQPVRRIFTKAPCPGIK